MLIKMKYNTYDIEEVNFWTGIIWISETVCMLPSL